MKGFPRRNIYVFRWRQQLFSEKHFLQNNCFFIYQSTRLLGARTVHISVAEGWQSGCSPSFGHRGGARNFPTRGLKYGFQGTIIAKNLRKNRFSPPDGGLACSDGGYRPPSHPLAPPLVWAQIRFIRATFQKE